MSITGKCHCGNVHFELEWPEDQPDIPARACGCTFCVRHGGVWTSSPDAGLVVHVREPAQVSKYAFGTGTAVFHVCARCGVVPVVTSEIGGRLHAVVHVGAPEGVDPSRLRPSALRVGEEDAEARLARAGAGVDTEGALRRELRRGPERRVRLTPSSRRPPARPLAPRRGRPRPISA